MHFNNAIYVTYMCLVNKENKKVQLLHNNVVLKNKIMFMKRNKVFKKAVGPSVIT